MSKAQEMMLKFWINSFLTKALQLTTRNLRTKYIQIMCVLLLSALSGLWNQSLDSTRVKGQTTRLFIIARLFILCKGTNDNTTGGNAYLTTATQ